MNIKASAGFVAVGLLAFGALSGEPARAAAPMPGFVGSTASSVAGCPYITWRLMNTNGQIHGIAYYSDLSGLSNVTGTSDSATGKFSLTLTKTDIGNGPVGTVDGVRGANGALDATLTGEGCANNVVHIMPMRDLNNLQSMSGRGR